MTTPLILIDYNAQENNGSDMLEQTVQQKNPSLEGMVRCGVCNTTMTLNGGEYSCNNTGCGTISIGAEDLLTRVITKLADRIAGSGAADRLVENIQETNEMEAKVLRNQLFAAEHNITAQGSAKANALREVEEGNRRYSEVTDQVREIDNTIAGLAYEAMVARDELDRLEFIGEEDGIRKTAGDPKTYLEGPEPDLVQQLLELVVREVRVKDGEAAILYRDPFPTRERPSGILRDRISLD